MDRSIRYKSLERILLGFGLELRPGQGSEVVIFDPVRTRKRHVIGCHGRNPEIPRQVTASLRRKFLLAAEHGVSNATFYGDAN